jgi:hypothetical protein
VSPVKYELNFYIPEAGIPHSHHHENLKSTYYINIFIFLIITKINQFKHGWNTVRRQGQLEPVYGPRWQIWLPQCLLVYEAMYYTAGCSLPKVNGGKEISCWSMPCNSEVPKWFIVCRWRLITIKRNCAQGSEGKHYFSIVTTVEVKEDYDLKLQVQRADCTNFSLTTFRYGHKYWNPTVYWTENHIKTSRLQDHINIYKTEINDRRGSAALTTRHPSFRKSWR